MPGKRPYYDDATISNSRIDESFAASPSIDVDNGSAPPIKRPRRSSNSPTTTSFTVKNTTSTNSPLFSNQNDIDRLSGLSDELLIRILQNLPISSLLLCQQLSQRLQKLAVDCQVWKGLYFERFGWRRRSKARIPRNEAEKGGESDRAESHASFPDFEDKQRRWVRHEEDWMKIFGGDWKGMYKLKYNWQRGFARVRKIDIAADFENGHSPMLRGEKTTTPVMIRLVESLLVTVDFKAGLRFYDVKSGMLITRAAFDDVEGCKAWVPSALSVNADRAGTVNVVVGFNSGGFGIWKLDNYRHRSVREDTTRPSNETPSPLRLERWCWQPYPGHPRTVSSSDRPRKRLEAVSYHHPILLTMTTENFQIYSFPASGKSKKYTDEDGSENKPLLLESLVSQKSWMPLCLSLRTSPAGTIAAIVYSIPSWSVGIQEFHLGHNNEISMSRLATACPTGLLALSSPPHRPPLSSTSTLSSNWAAQQDLQTLNTPDTSSWPPPSRADYNHPTSISYRHPYLIVGNTDNTLKLYLVKSDQRSLQIGHGKNVYGHTSGLDDVEVGGRGKAVSLGKGGEVQLWDLEGVWERRKMVTVVDKDRNGHDFDHNDNGDAIKRKKWKGWVGFDEEVVVSLNGESVRIYDFR